MFLRKAQPGSDSFGHVWATDKSVVEVTDEEGAALLAIADAGFTVVSPPADEEEDQEPTPPAPPAASDTTPPAPEEEKPVLEVDPDGHDNAHPAPAKKAAAKKAAPPAGRRPSH